MIDEQQESTETEGDDATIADQDTTDAATADIQAAVSGQTLQDAADAGDEEAAAAAQERGDAGDAGTEDDATT